MIERAIEYASFGWLVLPVVPRGKHRVLATPSRDIEQIRTWWKEMPDANLGVELGEASNLIDIEEDGPRAQQMLINVFGAGGIPKTTAYRSSRGIHRLFAYCDVPSFTVEQLEIRTAGQSVLPPSIHKDGSAYTWIVPPSELKALPSHAAEWLTNFHSTYWHIKSLCQKGVDERCTQCGDAVHGRQTCRASYRGRTLGERREPQARCEHAVDPSAPVELLNCGTCRGNVRKKYHRCTKCGGLVACESVK
jgi:hypothetical protein